jgi:hypothetical protein
LIEWFPWLPELPEHRRLGYKPPRNLDDVVVVSGQPIEQKGMSGWLNKRMQAAQETANARQQEMAAQKAAKSGKPASASSNGDVIETTSKSDRKGTSYQDRVDAATRSKVKATSSPQVAQGADPNPNSKASKKAARRAAQETTSEQPT